MGRTQNIAILRVLFICTQVSSSRSNISVKSDQNLEISTFNLKKKLQVIVMNGQGLFMVTRMVYNVYMLAHIQRNQGNSYNKQNIQTIDSRKVLLDNS